VGQVHLKCFCFAHCRDRDMYEALASEAMLEDEGISEERIVYVSAHNQVQVEWFPQERRYHSRCTGDSFGMAQ
jgi:hypothetical protein